MTKHGTNYALDPMIGANADIKPRPDEQVKATRVLRDQADAADLAQMLGLEP